MNLESFDHSIKGNTRWGHFFIKALGSEKMIKIFLSNKLFPLLLRLGKKNFYIKILISYCWSSDSEII